MPEKPLFCLGEAWVELGADTVPELAETFRVSVGGWGAAFCRAYVRAGGHAALLSQLGADPFGRKAAAQLAADGIDDVRKYLRRRGAMVEHTAAVVRDHDAARARLQRLFRAAGGHNAL